MGGHGGLNILPQKRWNVYNRDNREKVEKDKRKYAEKKNAEEKTKFTSQSSLRLEILKIEGRKKRKEDRRNFHHKNGEEVQKSQLSRWKKILKNRKNEFFFLNKPERLD